MLKFKNGFQLLILVVLLGINACTNQTAIVPPTVQAEEIITSNVTPYYTGIALEVEMDRLNAGHLDIVEIISDLDDIRALPQVIIYDNPTLNLVIFACHINYHSGSRIGSIMRYRICRIDNDFEQAIIVEGIYETSFLPDEEWIALIGHPTALHKCEHQIYVMRPDGTILYSLIHNSVFAHQRFCAINNLEWQVEDEVYRLSFSAWTGSDYPYHQLVFDAENMHVTLTLNDNTSFEYNVSPVD